jgi:hypothetical protein
MHDYRAMIIHDDRMRTLRAEAAESRLAAELRRDRGRSTLATARGWLRQGFGRTSGWARRDALAHGFGGGLRPATDPQLREDA